MIVVKADDEVLNQADIDAWEEPERPPPRPADVSAAMELALATVSDRDATMKERTEARATLREASRRFPSGEYWDEAIDGVWNPQPPRAILSPVGFRGLPAQRIQSGLWRVWGPVAADDSRRARKADLPAILDPAHRHYRKKALPKVMCGEGDLTVNADGEVVPLDPPERARAMEGGPDGP